MDGNKNISHISHQNHHEYSLFQDYLDDYIASWRSTDTGIVDDLDKIMLESYSLTFFEISPLLLNNFPCQAVNGVNQPLLVGSVFGKVKNDVRSEPDLRVTDM